MASYGYDVFGGIRSQSGTGDTMFKFTGEQLDADSGAYYLRARYYDPAIGRFLGRDPLPAANLYPYAGNNPIRFVDPYGLCKVKVKVWETAKECTEEAVGGGKKFVTKTLPEAASIAIDYLSEPSNLASAAQIVSGAVITLSCGPQDAVLIPSALVCGGALGVYGLATTAKVLLAQGTCEKVVAGTTGVAGVIPVSAFANKVIAGFSGAADAIACPSPAYAWGFDSQSKE